MRPFNNRQTNRVRFVNVSYFFKWLERTPEICDGCGVLTERQSAFFQSPWEWDEEGDWTGYCERCSANLEVE